MKFLFNQRRADVKLTNPTKKRTATDPACTSGYCIHVLRTAIRYLKLFAVEKTPMKSSNGLSGERGVDFNASILTIWSESSDVGKPLARTEISFKSPEIFTSLTSHGSKVWVRSKPKQHKIEHSEINVKTINTRMVRLLHGKQKK